MGEKFRDNISKEYKFKNKELYDRLVREHNLEVTSQQIIFTLKNGDKHYIQKWAKLPKKDGGFIDLEEHIEKIINEN